jgi:hypothetical protein
VAETTPECPYWPQLPQLGPSEFMLAQWQVDPELTAGFVPFLRALGAATFLGARFVKGQLVGPATARAALRLTASDSLRQFRRQASLQIAALRMLGLPVMLQVDEPAPAFQDLPLIQEALGVAAELGAAPVLHCCGVLPAGELELPGVPWWFSFDQAIPSPDFSATGATPIRGVISTNLGRRDLPAPPRGPIAEGDWISPACGLGLLTISDAERMMSELHALGSVDSSSSSERKIPMVPLRSFDGERESGP